MQTSLLVICLLSAVYFSCPDPEKLNNTVGLLNGNLIQDYLQYAEDKADRTFREYCKRFFVDYVNRIGAQYQDKEKTQQANKPTQISTLYKGAPSFEDQVFKLCINKPLSSANEITQLKKLLDIEELLKKINPALIHIIQSKYSVLAVVNFDGTKNYIVKMPFTIFKYNTRDANNTFKIDGRFNFELLDPEIKNVSTIRLKNKSLSNMEDEVLILNQLSNFQTILNGTFVKTCTDKRYNNSNSIVVMEYGQTLDKFIDSVINNPTNALVKPKRAMFYNKLASKFKILGSKSIKICDFKLENATFDPMTQDFKIFDFTSITFGDKRCRVYTTTYAPPEINQHLYRSLMLTHLLENTRDSADAAHILAVANKLKSSYKKDIENSGFLQKHVFSLYTEYVGEQKQIDTIIKSLDVRHWKNDESVDRNMKVEKVVFDQQKNKEIVGKLKENGIGVDTLNNLLKNMYDYALFLNWNPDVSAVTSNIPLFTEKFDIYTIGVSIFIFELFNCTSECAIGKLAPSPDHIAACTDFQLDREKFIQSGGYNSESNSEQKKESLLTNDWHHSQVEKVIKKVEDCDKCWIELLRFINDKIFTLPHVRADWTDLLQFLKSSQGTRRGLIV